MVTSISKHLHLTSDDTSLLVLHVLQRPPHRSDVGAAGGGQRGRRPRLDRASFWRNVEEHATFFSAVPTIYAVLDAQTVRRVDTSSPASSSAGPHRCRRSSSAGSRRGSGSPVVEGYGLSEGSVASAREPGAGPRKPGTVGRALPGAGGGDASAGGGLPPQGDRGEVVIRGANVMRGYLGRPEATAEAFVDGWLHTGDVGHLDDDGYLVLVGPDQGHDHPRRGEHLPQGDRDGRSPPS